MQGRARDLGEGAGLAGLPPAGHCLLLHRALGLKRLEQGSGIYSLLTEGNIPALPYEELLPRLLLGHLSRQG